MKTDKKLYRQKNTGGWLNHKVYGDKQHYRYSRHTKAVNKEIDDEVPRQKMVKRNKGYLQGYSFIPLYKYLYSHVGDKFKDLLPDLNNKLKPFSVDECLLPIIKDTNDGCGYFRTGEDRVFQTLYIDENGCLQYVLGKKYTTRCGHAKFWATPDTIIPPVVYGNQWGASINGISINMKRQKKIIQ